MELYRKSTKHAHEARQVMRAYLLSTHFVMAVVVITSSQPSTHAYIYNAYRATCNRIQAIRR
eukprot:631808-Pleurochrysis_carterae.AAC.1